MVNNYQFPYSKIIRETGEVIPATDHNKQENQLECLTDAIGNYNFLAGSIETRLQSIVGDISSIVDDITTIQGDITTIQGDIVTIVADITSLDARVTALETAPPLALNDLADVNAPSPSIGDVLTFTGSWVPQPASTTLADLEDVDLTGAQVGDSLVLGGTGGDTWLPEDRRVTVASGLPGSLDESEVFPVSEIRFVSLSGAGEEHEVVPVSAGVAYIGAGPPPALLATLTGLTGLVSGRMSNDGTATYPPLLSAGDIYASITQNGTWAFNTGASEFGLASEGNLILSVNGVDVANIDLSANFVEADRETGQNVAANYNVQGTGDVIVGGVVTFVGGDLTLNSVAPLGGIPVDAYQQGSATVNLTSAALQTGYNIVVLRHENSLGTTMATLEWFYDTNAPGNPNDPDLTGFVLSSGISVFNPLSGINYYDTGTTFELDVTGNDLFDNVYVDTEEPIQFVPTDIWASSVFVNIADASVSGLSTPPIITETMTVTNFIVTVIAGAMVSDARVSAVPIDPYGTYSNIFSPPLDITIMSDPSNNTDVFEDFKGEQYRLPNTTNFNIPVPGMPGAPLVWDSTISLTAGARAGELQVYDHLEVSDKNRLQYPVFDYTTNFRPLGNPDYSALPAGVRTYYRVFRSTTGDKTNGIITFPGVSESDLTMGLGLRIKIPGKTVWLDLTAPFNGGTFPTGAPLVGGVDGEGCRINSGVHSLDIDGSIEFSLGAIGTDLTSDRQLILEITYATSGVTEVTGAGSGLSINW